MPSKNLIAFLVLAFVFVTVAVVSVISDSNKKQNESEIVPSATVSQMPIPSASIPPRSLNIDLGNISLSHSSAFTPIFTDEHFVYAVKNSSNIFVTIAEQKLNNISYSEFSLMFIRDTRNSGATVSEAEQKMIDGYPWIVIQSSKDEVKLLQAVTTNQDKGYVFSCGGTSDITVCDEIISSLKLK